MAIDTELSDAAVDSYFQSGGDASLAIREQGGNRGGSYDSETARDRASGRQHDYSWATPAQRHALETGDLEPARAEEHAQSPQGQREVQQQHERHTWNEHQALVQQLQEKDDEILRRTDREARLETRLGLINEAFEEPTERLRIAEADAEWARNNIRPDPLQDAYAAMEFDRRQVETLKRQLALRDQRDQANAHLARYGNEALQYEGANPGYIQEVYAPFQRTLRTTLANTRPGLNAQQIEQLAVQEEVRLHDMARAQGRSPHELLHHVARDWGIESTHERQQRENWARKQHAAQQRAQAEAAEAARKRELSALDNELARVGGLTSRAAYDSNPYIRDLWDRAKKAGRIRGGF